MQITLKIRWIFGFLLMTFFISTFQQIVFSQTKIPSPKLIFYGTQDSVNGLGNALTIYWLGIENRDEFPDQMFAPAPDLPPCGKNTNASRSWVNVYDNANHYLYGFCAIKSASELNKISFSLPKNQKTPEYVYVVILDRKINKKYSSNLLSLKKAEK